MKKILILGDSLALERDHVPKKKTYPELLKGDYEVINASKSAYHLNAVDINKLPDADVLVFALGVCDCAPRVLSLKAKKTVGKLPAIIRKPYLHIITKLGPYKIFFRKSPIQHTPLPDYKKKLGALVKKYGTVLLLTIPIVGEVQEQRKPGYQYQALLYNQHLHQLAEKHAHCHILDTFALSLLQGERKIYYPDIANHWNVVGNRLVYESLKKRLREILGE